jgi:hypothetical protein
MQLSLEISKKLKWVIVNDKPLNEDVKESFKNYYIRFVERHKDPIESIFFNKPYHALEWAYSKGYEYCLLSWEGLLILDQPKFYSSILKHISELDASGEWLVSGHIIDDASSVEFWNKNNPNLDDKWYYLWPINCIINLKVWNSLGKPQFGNLGYSEERIPEVIRSESNIHDNYTPLIISSGNNHIIKRIECKHGFNMIRTSLENNLSISNIPPFVRTYVEYTYPENNIDSYNNTIMLMQEVNKGNINFKLFKTLMSLTDKMTKTSFCAFNSEGVGIANNSKLYNENYYKVDTILYPTQGFKDFVYAFGNSCPFEHNVTFIHYDLLPDVVGKRKQLTEEWDCTLEYLIDKKLINFDQNYKKGWDELLAHFDNFDHMKIQWNKYKRCRHYYITQNLLYELEEKNITNLLKKLNTKNMFFMYSDIFPWESNLLVRGSSNLLKLENSLRNHFKNNVDFLLVESKGVIRNDSLFEVIE